MLHTIKKGIKIPTRCALLADTEANRDPLQASIVVMLKDQHVCMTAEDWASNTSDAFISFRVVSVNRDWEVANLLLNCANSEGCTTGYELTK